MFFTLRALCKVVECADCLEDIVPMLKQIGGRHGKRGYAVPAEYFPVSHLKFWDIDLESDL